LSDLTSTRALARQKFAETQLGCALHQSVASADASFRSYWRFADLTANQSWIVMDAPPEKEDCRPFVDVSQRLLHAGIMAPKVHAHDQMQGFLLLPDFGTRMLLPDLNAQSVELLYGDALQEILHMQQVDAQGLPHYDAEKLGMELELFPEWFLQRHLGLDAADSLTPIWQQTRTLLIESALSQQQCFVHRDFHSRNLMLGNQHPQTSSRYGVIDFQDAVYGPVSYDAVSLLRDCYIEWPDTDVARWREGFRQRTEASLAISLPAERFAQQFDWMGVQRHLKVLGIFARLNYRDGKARYLADLPLVLRYTLKVCRAHAALQPFANWLSSKVGNIELTVPRMASGKS
jgi:N-acetylmuramate 1-kinase